MCHKPIVKSSKICRFVADRYAIAKQAQSPRRVMGAEFKTLIKEPEGRAISEVVIRAPSAEDVAGLAALFSEMQRHYQRPVPDEVAVEAARLACRPPVATF